MTLPSSVRMKLLSFWSTRIKPTSSSSPSRLQVTRDFDLACHSIAQRSKLARVWETLRSCSPPRRFLSRKTIVSPSQTTELRSLRTRPAVRCSYPVTTRHPSHPPYCPSVPRLCVPGVAYAGARDARALRPRYVLSPSASLLSCSPYRCTPLPGVTARTFRPSPSLPSPTNSPGILIAVFRSAEQRTNFSARSHHLYYITHLGAVCNNNTAELERVNSRFSSSRH
jgi:hypothetical protein